MTYVSDANPITKVDPSGQTSEVDTVTGIALMAVGVIVGIASVIATVFTGGGAAAMAVAAISLVLELGASGMGVAAMANDAPGQAGFLSGEQRDILVWGSTIAGAVGAAIGLGSMMQSLYRAGPKIARWANGVGSVKLDDGTKIPRRPVLYTVGNDERPALIELTDMPKAKLKSVVDHLFSVRAGADKDGVEFVMFRGRGGKTRLAAGGLTQQASVGGNRASHQAPSRAPRAGQKVPETASGHERVAWAMGGFDYSQDGPH